MTKSCTIILYRNLPEPTNALYEHLMKYDQEHNETYVIEAGSDKDKLSKYCTWYANSPEIMKDIVNLLQVSYPEIDYETLLSNLTIIRLGDTKLI